MKRNANAIWKGNLKAGEGQMTTDSGVLENTPYSFGTRFQNAPGTNPEELIAAAHSGCFSMALSNLLSEAGGTVNAVKASCDVTLKDLDITDSHLTVEVDVDGLEQDKIKQCLEDAKAGCPVSKVLNANITMDYTIK